MTKKYIRQAQHKNSKSGQTKYKREFSAGGVVYKKSKIKNQKSKIFWLIGKHSGYHKWVLPKGLIDPGEKSEETAVREVEEEMGVKAKIVEKMKPAEKYVYSMNGKKIFKIVQYYLMEYVSGDTKDHDFEMEEVGWFEFDGAYKKLGFWGQKKLLTQAKQMIENKK